MMFWNKDCVQGAREHLDAESVDLLICDPPFGINETTFDKHYNRDEAHVLDGYVEAPKDYYTFSLDWLKEAFEVLKPDGSLYVVSGWTNLKDILNALDNVGFRTINHIIWKYGFGINTSKKFVSSHYHILYLCKLGGKPKFNQLCRYGVTETVPGGGSALYRDLEDVWTINKDYRPGEVKNKNKLPNELVQKMVQYSSDPGDLVGDFFLGNFTTAFVAHRLGRRVTGFELNPASFQHFAEEFKTIPFGCDLETLKQVKDDRPANQGKPVTAEEREAIRIEFKELTGGGKTKKEAVARLAEKYGRGKWSVLRMVG